MLLCNDKVLLLDLLDSNNKFVLCLEQFVYRTAIDSSLCVTFYGPNYVKADTLWIAMRCDNGS